MRYTSSFFTFLNTQIDDGELIHCYGMVQDFMDLQLTKPHKGSTRSRKRRKRCSNSSSVEILPTIEEAGNEECATDEATADDKSHKVEDEDVFAKGPEPVEVSIAQNALYQLVFKCLN